MKKFFIVLSIFAMSLSFAACGHAENSNTTTTNAAPSAPAATEASTAESTQPATEESTPAETDKSDAQANADSPAVQLSDAFHIIIRDGKGDSAEAIVNCILDSELLPFAGAAMEVEPGFLNGFDHEITGFKSGQMFGPMIGSIPFIGYVFELASEADAPAFMKTLTDNANLRWNVCTQADEMKCEADGNKIFFVMSPATFEE